jgi:hypothetical protein
MKNLRTLTMLAGAAAVLALPAAEALGAWWMRPNDQARHEQPPQWVEVRRRPDFESKPEEYARVSTTLHCSNGWMGRLTLHAGGPAISLGWFEWRDTDTPNTLEAFKHLPEECMGASGVPLEAFHPARIFEAPEGTIIFDSSTFRPLGGGSAIHVFKAVWIAGYEGLNLREEAFATGELYKTDLRKLRLKAAMNRFRPPRACVMMASITGLPTEALAWDAFRLNVLQADQTQNAPE